MTLAPHPPAPQVLDAYFRAAALRWPDAVAVDVPPGVDRPDRRRLSYRQLARRAEQVGAALRPVTAGAPGIVAILLPRTDPDLFAAQIGVLAAGSAFVCLDPAFPDGHLAHVLRDADVTALLTDVEGALRADRIGHAGPVLTLDGPAGAPAPVGQRADSPADLAYVIYTSGTTGRPKGVLIPHAGIANLIASDLAAFDLRPGDRVAQGSSAAYDSSVEETWLALASGATVVVVDDATARLGPDLVPWLRAERITMWCPPPTLLRATGCTDPGTELPDLRLLYVGGEALPDDIASRWARGRRMVNGYGPTECSVTCLRSDVVAGAPVAVGHPVGGMRAWVLDEDLRPVPPGERGELCMSGPGVALGYLNQPELTAARFPQVNGVGRVYRTGDLVHAGADGTLFYHGRADSQVKVRGFRIELEAVEAYLAGCPGVREAACAVQGDDTPTLVAFVVAADPQRPPVAEELAVRLRESLPAYMIPARIGTIGALPRGVSGKLRRGDLPRLAPGAGAARGAALAPRNPLEAALAEAVAEVVGPLARLGIDDDFFADLGGSSLQAALLVSRLRADPATAMITVRDVYDARTVRDLARRAADPAADPATAPAAPPIPRPRRGSSAAAPPDRVRSARPVAATVAQAAWLAGELLVAAPLAYLVAFRLLPWVSRSVGLVPLLLLAPIVLAVAGMLWTPLAVLLAVAAKRLLVGRYVPERVPAFTARHVRIWLVRQLTRLVPWNSVAGTEFQCMVLRALGARVGRRVHLHRGVDLLAGGWDLLEIGDDVTLAQDASLGLVRFEQGHVVVGPVTVADGATLDVRAGVAGHTRVGRNALLTALSALPAGGAVPDGETWDGVPARRVGPAPRPPEVAAGRQWSPVAHGLAMVAARRLLQTALAVPFLVASTVLVSALDLTYDSVLAALAHPLGHATLLAATAALVCVGVVAGVALEAVAVRALGRVGEGVLSRWSVGYLRVWLTSGLVDSAGRWLSGGLFWPVWLRWAGMTVGRGCEISTIIDVVPELVRIGPGTFFADGIYLAGPRLHRGTVTLARAELGGNTFLGNHVVVPGGQRLPADILLGVCTVADDRWVRPGTSWFGHPPFELPRREIVAADRSVTHDPPPVRVASRLFWEWLRFALPIGPLALLVFWVATLTRLAGTVPPAALLAVGAAAVTAGTAALAGVAVLALKWTLLGRVRPGTHPLWSCWCSRWDFLYVAWGFLAGPVLAPLEGTLLLAGYLRATGMRIGRRVLFGEGFAQVVDPDMLDIGDDATVNAMFQAHTFEDRVLKIGPVRVGAGATLADGTVPLYGADIGDGAYVASHSVVMKHERLLAGVHYEGVPTAALTAHAAVPREGGRPAAG